MSKNTVKTNCPFYHHPKSCKMLQVKRNCYLCPLVELENRKKDFRKLDLEYWKLVAENRDLKLLLGEKIIKEYQASKHKKGSVESG